MAAHDQDAHWQEIRTIHRDYKFFYQIGGGIVLVLLGIWIGSKLFGGDAGFATNIYTEVLSIVVTVFVLNTFAKRREVHQLQQQLIRNAASTSNEIAKDAIHQMDKSSLLIGEKGLLQGQRLWNANLNGAYMPGANLKNADLSYSNMSNAYLFETDMRSAYLEGVDFTKAELFGAKFSGAYLGHAKLIEAHLESADLSDTDLEEVDFSGADLTNAFMYKALLSDTIFNEHTILPDGTHWTPATDMDEFTDLDLPENYVLKWVLVKKGSKEE